MIICVSFNYSIVNILMMGILKLNCCAYKFLFALQYWHMAVSIKLTNDFSLSALQLISHQLCFNVLFKYKHKYLQLHEFCISIVCQPTFPVSLITLL